MRLLTLILAFALFAILGVTVYETSAQPGPRDKLILRDGHEVSGRLNSANQQTVKFNGELYDRAQVKAIRLNGAPNPAPEAGALDLLMRRDGTINTGRITNITDKLVFQDNAQVQRVDVAVIEFANPAHIITVSPEPIASPTVTPSESPSPSSSPSPAAGGSPAQESSPEPGSDANASQATTPPWFNTKGCAWAAKPYVFVDGSPSGTQGKVNCRMWLNVCGTVVERRKVVDTNERCWTSRDLSQPEICCDIWTKYINNPDGRWNPRKDADGDGIPNDQDDDPLGPKRPQ